MTITEFLIKKNIIDKQKAGSLEYEAKTSGKKEEEIILEKGILSESALFDLKSQNLKIDLKTPSLEDNQLNIL